MDNEKEIDGIKEEIIRHMKNISQKADNIIEAVEDENSENAEIDDIFIAISRMNLILESSSNSLSEWLLLEKKEMLDELKSDDGGQGNVGFNTDILGQ